MDSQAAVANDSRTSRKRRQEAVPSPSVRSARTPVPWSVLIATLAAALVTAALLWLSYFPVACGPCAWVALVPLLSLVRTKAPAWSVYLCALVAGLGFFLPVLDWMPVADHRMYYTWAMLAAYCALYFPVAIYLLRRLDSCTVLPLCLTLPLVWTGLEFLRSFLFTGFAWYFLAHSQHAFLELIQVADLAGAYAVTFLVAAVNGLLFEWLYGADWFRHVFLLREAAATAWRRRNSLAVQTGAVVGLLAMALVYGNWRLAQNDFQPGPRLAMLQGNLDQRIRNQASFDNPNRKAGKAAFASVNEHFTSLAKKAIRLDPRPNLIVWPETSCPFEWYDTARAISPDQVSKRWAELHDAVRLELRSFANNVGTDSLLGLNSNVLIDPRQLIRYNSALLVRASGQTGGRYDKIHRVPFGEYVPLRDALPFMNSFAPYEFDYSIRKGEHLPRLQLGQHRFGVIICNEDTDPELARQYAQPSEDGPAADFLVNISNDGWFDGSAEHEQHLAVARFRAIEARRAVARAVNMGVSAVIDGNGRVLRPQTVGFDGDLCIWAVPPPPAHPDELPYWEWKSFKKIRGILVATMPIDDRTSLYARWGDWFPWSCCAVAGIALVVGAVRRRRGAV